MDPLFREILVGAIWFLPGARHGGHIRAARMEEMRLMLSDVYREGRWPGWPAGARALVHLVHAVATGKAVDIPAGAIGRACDDRWAAAPAGGGDV